MINSVTLVGRLVRDPELRYTSSGTATTSFTLALDNPIKDKPADFIPCVTWKGLAESVANYTKKGSLIGLTGRISTRNYEKDGRKIYVTEIVAENVRFLDSKKSERSNEEPPVFEGEPVSISDSDLPF